ncbi:MAG: hypothetical protein H0X66_02230 [Verrucomicrobia bacterium]|nr:hypothetical protein [Verrucomicrobiota bacterium]
MRLLKIAAVLFSLITVTSGWLAAETIQPPRFTGMPSCSSTSCHGGASEEKNQCVIWSKLDFHSRSYATLTSARSERMAEVLKIEDATKSAQCTTCHAPFQTVSEKLLAQGIKISQGVSCESCHGAAEPWLLSHTRPDFNHFDRVASGMRDLKNLYVRANTCVACHQTLEPELAAAGHPELIFELDGQSVSQPKHWREKESYSGAQAWYIGQLVALREMSWQLAREENADKKLHDRWAGLLWLVRATGMDVPSGDTESERTHYTRVQKRADDAARQAADARWNADHARKQLRQLAETFPEFQNKEVPVAVHARRAERLVLGLDRLAGHSGYNQKLDPEINQLFALTQSLPDFNPARFSKELEKLSRKLIAE